MNPNKDINNLWKTVLGEIETEVSKGNFLTLFKPTSLISLENSTATIVAPSNMIIDLLKKRFSLIIKKSLDKNTGSDINIIFIPKTLDKIKNTKIDAPLFNFDKNKEDLRIEENNSQEPNQGIGVQKLLSRVRPDFIFETMAVSSSNQLAFVSAQTVARNIGHSYNPLFIYGPVGVGKTHLMQSIANDLFQRDNSKKIIYITSEEFTNEVVEAIRFNDTGRMKKRFRSVDLLIIDDVQFIAGKERVQEELFHTFNILIDKAAQVVLSSDRPPEEIKKLEKRLSSRFSAGLTVDIEAPDFELRCAILLIKAKKLGFELPMDIAKAIAEKIQDVRRLEGTLLRILTEVKTKGEEVSMELAVKVSNGQKKEGEIKLHADDVIKKVCIFYDIKSTQLKGPKRDAFLVQARQITMYLLKKELGLTFTEIGNLLGGRDHTTIIHGVGKVEKLLINKAKISTEVMGITKLISE